MTVVNRKTEPVIRQAVRVTFTLSHGDESESEEAFPIKEVYPGDPRRKSISHESSSWLGSAGLRHGEESCWSRACGNVGSGLRETRSQSIEMIAISRLWKRNTIFCGIGEQVITSFIKLLMPGALGGQDVHNALSITDGSTPPLVGHEFLLPWRSSVHLYLGDSWLEIDGDDVRPCVGEHGRLW